MDDDQFTKLFKYIEEFRNEMSERMDGFDDKLIRSISLLNGSMGKPRVTAGLKSSSPGLASSRKKPVFH